MRLDDVAGEHHLGIWHMDRSIPCSIRRAKLADIDPPLAHPDNQLAVEGGGPSQAGNAYKALELLRIVSEFAIQNLLARFSPPVRAASDMLTCGGLRA
jgi:hypothetical protein